MSSHAKRLRRARGALAGVLCGAGLALGAACSGRCGPEAERTGRELESARRVQAEAYAPGTLARAVDLSEQASAECREQESRFPLARSFSTARHLHALARTEAEKAARQAAVNAGFVRQEALNARYLAAQRVEQARSALLRARRARGEAAVADLGESLGRLLRALEDLQLRIDRNDFIGARDRGTRVVDEALLLEAEANRRTLAGAPH